MYYIRSISEVSLDISGHHHKEIGRKGWHCAGDTGFVWEWLTLHLAWYSFGLANALGIDRGRHLDKHTDLVNDLYFSFRLVLASSVSLVSTQASSFTSLLILFPPSLCLCGSPVRFGICKSRCIFEQEHTTVDKYRSLPSSAGRWSRVSSACMSLADIQSFWQTMAYSLPQCQVMN